MHFQAQSSCFSAKPVYGQSVGNGCNNNNGNSGTNLPADFSQTGYASWSRYCYMRIFASPPPAAPSSPPPRPTPPPLPPQPQLPPLPPAAPPLPPKAYAYKIVQSGTCETAGGESIPSSLAACTAAGEALSIFSASRVYSSPHVPSGCTVNEESSRVTFNPTFSVWTCGRITSSKWYCVCRFDMQPPQPPPAPPLLPLPPLPPPLPSLQPGSEYVRSSSEFVAALEDSSIDRIMVTAGVYEFTDSKCFKAMSGIDEDFIGSALCIDRAVTIEAVEAGTVELNAKGQRRVISIRSGVATLIGLTITGGYSLEGGGLYVAAGGGAKLEGCVVRKNHATTGGGLYVAVGGVANMESCRFDENTAQYNGGGLEIWGTAGLTTCEIHLNTATEAFGGGLYVGAGATAAVTDCRLYENTAAHGGGAYNNGELTLTTSLLKRNTLERNTGPNGAQLSLARGSELIYILPVPLGHYLVGAVMCQEQTCKEDETCSFGCDYKPCDTQFCDPMVLNGKYIKAYRPSSDEAHNDQFPKACLAGVQGSSSDTQDQSSPFCAGACDAGFYCPLGTSQPLPCAAGRYSRGGAKTAEECPRCSPGSVANSTGMNACTQCAAGTFQDKKGELTCEPCTAGSYCEKGAAAALPCPGGSHSSSTSLTLAEECTPTEMGHYAPTGSTSQTVCNRGMYANKTGMPTCALCEPGKYQPEAGTTVCIACAVASYCPGLGTASPTPCPGGTYSNVSGLYGVLQCTDVEPGFWAPTGSAFPEECPESGFTCPGSALDVANQPPGSKPILINAGQASVDIEEVFFSLKFNAGPDEFDLDVVIAQLAAHYQVDASLISANATRLSNGRRLTSDGTTINAGNRLLLTITIRVPEKSEDEAMTLETFASHLAKLDMPELFGAGSLLTQKMTISTRVVGQESVVCPKGYCEALPFNYQH